MREIRTSGSEGGGAKPIASPYPYQACPALDAGQATERLLWIPAFAGMTLRC